MSRGRFSTKLCVAKTFVEGPSANAPVDNPSASQRVCSAEWPLSGKSFKGKLRDFLHVS